MAETPFNAHSVGEISMYARITPCTACGHGPLEEHEPAEAVVADEPTIVLYHVRCRACHHKESFRFRLPQEYDGTVAQGAGVLNQSDEPSQIIDLAQWLTLYSVLLDEADRKSDMGTKRRLQIQAGACLTEALKFYVDPENDLPPPTAVFHDASMLKLKESPHFYSRQRLINLRAKLPKPMIK